MSGVQVFKSDFVRSLMKTFGAKVSAVLIGLLTSILIARTLGPDGRGVFASIITLIAIGTQFANLGLHTSNSYFLAKDKSILPSIISNSVFVALGLGTLTGFLLMGIAWATGVAASAGKLVVSLAMLSVPIGLVYMLLVNLLVVLGAINTFNRIEFSLRLTTFLMTAFVGYAMSPSPGLFVLAALVAQIYGVGSVWKALGADFLSLRKVSRGMFLRQIPFAFRSYIASLLSFLLIRVDILIVQSISGNEEVGYYSIAVAIADMIYLIPASAGLLLFPRLTEMANPAERRRATFKAAGIIGGLMTTISVLAAILAPFAIDVLYGQAFKPSVPMLHFLLVAIVLYGLNNIFSIHLASMGLPWSSVWIWAIGLAINVMLNFLLVPSMGGQGAALASLIAYSLVLIAQFNLIMKEKEVAA